MSVENRSKLLRMTIRNIGCIGNESIDIALDNIVCLIGKNNAGKSTVLRAYELAKGSVPFDPTHDRHQHTQPDQPSEVLLEAHIPQGNVNEKWKQERGEFLVVKSRWQWYAPDFQKSVLHGIPPDAMDNRAAGPRILKLAVPIRYLLPDFPDHSGLARSKMRQKRKNCYLNLPSPLCSRNWKKLGAILNPIWQKRLKVYSPV